MAVSMTIGLVFAFVSEKLVAMLVSEVEAPIRAFAWRVVRTPSISPDDVKRDTYFVLDDFGGQLGCAWHKTDVEKR
jgi:hypothetical protein